jgi:membrane protease YdiL (CAAX protease family)
VIPYLISSLPQGTYRWEYGLAFFALPVVMAAVFELAPPPDRISWQDVLVLLIVGLPVEFGWFRGAWPQSGLGSLPKLLLMDGVLYAFLVVRDCKGVGYDFRPRWRDLAAGMREWAFFAPIAVVVGLVLGFIQYHGYRASALAFPAAWLVTFFFVAIPEELFFRGLLQNLVEKGIAHSGRAHSRLWALAIAAPLFGLSHFNKPGPFNWRYVLLATIAGVFYGRAWRDRRRLFCSGITHATVDVVWSLWFR